MEGGGGVARNCSLAGPAPKASCRLRSFRPSLRVGTPPYFLRLLPFRSLLGLRLLRPRLLYERFFSWIVFLNGLLLLVRLRRD